MSLRLKLILLAAGVGALAATHSAAYFVGRSHQAAQEALSDARDERAANTANARTQDAVSEAGGRHATNAIRLGREAANARLELETFDGAPAPGTVGSDARIDPGVGRPLLCRIERLRSVSDGPACADAAAHQPE